MCRTVYMVVGCPCAGKTWVCDQLRDDFIHVAHDSYGNAVSYVNAIIDTAAVALKPLLIETPFSVSQIKLPLEAAGLTVTPVFIQEDHRVLRDRYLRREGKPIPTGHLTRQHTYLERAHQLGAFVGTSSQVLAHLKQCRASTR